MDKSDRTDGWGMKTIRYGDTADQWGSGPSIGMLGLLVGGG
jgi:hypothetical protein